MGPKPIELTTVGCKGSAGKKVLAALLGRTVLWNKSKVFLKGWNVENTGQIILIWYKK